MRLTPGMVLRSSSQGLATSSIISRGVPPGVPIHTEIAPDPMLAGMSCTGILGKAITPTTRHATNIMNTVTGQ
jgi:hypothetical protein